jgi:hypothetical protein
MKRGTAEDTPMRHSRCGSNLPQLEIPFVDAVNQLRGELLEANSGDVSFPMAHAVVVHSTSELKEPWSALPSAHLTAFK